MASVEIFMGLYRFGRKLAELRTRRGLTRDQLADRSGYTRRAVEQWERAEREPSATALSNLAVALGVSCEVFTAELLAADPTNPPPRPKGRPRGKRRPGSG
jgi:transcriptional regulator with XRE-family HTH domain